MVTLRQALEATKRLDGTYPFEKITLLNAETDDVVISTDLDILASDAIYLNYDVEECELVTCGGVDEFICYTHEDVINSTREQLAMALRLFYNEAQKMINENTDLNTLNNVLKILSENWSEQCKHGYDDYIYISMFTCILQYLIEYLLVTANSSAVAGGITIDNIRRLLANLDIELDKQLNEINKMIEDIKYSMS